MTQHFFPPTETAAPARVETMQDVQDFLAANGPAYLVGALRTLKTHTNHEPLVRIEASVAWIDEHFPKVRKGVHPRPDLPQGIEAYKKWRADLRRAVMMATGATAAKEARKARDDGWAGLLAAVKLHTRDGGLIHAGAAGPVATLADIARRADLDPRHLGQSDIFVRLENVFQTPAEMNAVRKGFKTLSSYGFIPEIAAALPETPLAPPPPIRSRAVLPDHVDQAISRMVGVASMERDEVAGQDSLSIGDATRARYMAALRHHLRALPHCEVDPDLGYLDPVTDLAGVNDVAALFALDHLKATIRRTEAVEHLPDTLSQASASCYYADILVVLGRNGLADAGFVKQIRTSRFLREGRELADGMTRDTRIWCEALVTDPAREKRFRNMHRILQAKADEILDKARGEGRDPFDDRAGDLTFDELYLARSLGTAAAASAIEFACRPIRMANMLNLRFLGSTANFHTPSPQRPDYGLFLSGSETKAGKDEPFAPLRKELYGPQVMAWYLRVIRPLFPHAADNIHLFPAVETPGRPLGKGTFDLWFQKAAARAGLPMTFHRWRHGYASLLLAESWNNLQAAADMLGNTPAVCANSYAWVNKKKLYLAGQDIMIARSKAHK